MFETEEWERETAVSSRVRTVTGRMAEEDRTEHEVRKLVTQQKVQDVPRHCEATSFH